MQKIICLLLAVALMFGAFGVNSLVAADQLDYELDDDYLVGGDIPFLPGDVDLSGEVDLSDIVLLAQYVAGWDVVCQTVALDTNGDTECDLQDVTHLAQYVADWEGIELSQEEYIPDDYEEDYDDYYSENLYVYNSAAPITEQYRGMSGSAYHAYGYMEDRHGRNYTDTQRKIELDRLDDSGVRFARGIYSTTWVWNENIRGYDWNAERMTAFWNYCRALESRNINVVLQAGWSLDGFTQLNMSSITETQYIRDLVYADVYGESTGYDFSQCKNEAYELMARKSLRMGENLAQLILQAKARGINNISHFSYFVEPSYPTTITNNMPDYTHPAYGYEGGSAEEYIFVVKTIQQKLRDRGVYNLVQHMGPNQSIKHGEGLLKYMLDRDCADMFDVWSSHFYPSTYYPSDNVFYDISDPVFKDYMKTIKDAGEFGNVEFWVDEFYCKASTSKLVVDNPWVGLQNVVCAIAAQQRGINNISLWAIFDQLWTDHTNTGGEFENGIHICGSAPSLLVSDIPKKQYYTTGLFAKYNGYKNGKAYATNNTDLQMVASDIHIGAVLLEDGSWTITVVNAGIDNFKIDVNFEKAINQTLYKHSQELSKITPTAEAELAKAEKTFKNVTTKFTDVVKPASVNIYTGLRF